MIDCAIFAAAAKSVVALSLAESIHLVSSSLCHQRSMSFQVTSGARSSHHRHRGQAEPPGQQAPPKLGHGHDAVSILQCISSPRTPGGLFLDHLAHPSFCPICRAGKACNVKIGWLGCFERTMKQILLHGVSICWHVALAMHALHHASFGCIHFAATNEVHVLKRQAQKPQSYQTRRNPSAV